MAINTDLNKQSLQTRQTRGAFRPSPVQERAHSLASTLAQGSSVISQALQTANQISSDNVRMQQEEQEVRQRALKLKKTQQEEKDKRLKKAREAAQLEANTQYMLSEYGASEKIEIGEGIRRQYQAGEIGKAAGSSLAILNAAQESASLRVEEEQESLTPEALNDYDSTDRYTEFVNEELEAHGLSLRELSAYSSFDPESFNKSLKSLRDKGLKARDSLIDRKASFRLEQQKKAQAEQAKAGRFKVLDMLSENPDNPDLIYQLNEELAKGKKGKLPAEMRREAMLQVLEDQKDIILAGESEMSAEQYEKLMYRALDNQGNNTPSPIKEEQGTVMTYLKQVKAHYRSKAGAAEADPQEMYEYERKLKAIEESTQADPGKRRAELEALKKDFKENKHPGTYAKVETSLTKKIAQAHGKQDAIIDAQGDYASILKSDATGSDFAMKLKSLQKSYGMERDELVANVIKKDVNLGFDQEPQDFVNNIHRMAGNTRDFAFPTDVYDPAIEMAQQFDRTPMKDTESMVDKIHKLNVLAEVNKPLYQRIISKSSKAGKLAMHMSIQRATGQGDYEDLFQEVAGNKGPVDQRLDSNLREQISNSVSASLTELYESDMDIVKGFFNDTEATISQMPYNKALIKTTAQNIAEVTEGRLSNEDLMRATLEHLRTNVGFRLNNGEIVFNRPGQSNGVYSEELNKEVYEQDAMKARVFMLMDKRYESDPEMAKRTADLMEATYDEYYEYPDGDGSTTVVYGRRSMDDVVVPVMDAEGNQVRYKSDRTFAMHLHAIENQRSKSREQLDELINKPRQKGM